MALAIHPRRDHPVFPSDRRPSVAPGTSRYPLLEVRQDPRRRIRTLHPKVPAGGLPARLRVAVSTSLVRPSSSRYSSSLTIVPAQGSQSVMIRAESRGGPLATALHPRHWRRCRPWRRRRPVGYRQLRRRSRWYSRLRGGRPRSPGRRRRRSPTPNSRRGR